MESEFDCATWLHKAKELPKEDFKRAVDTHLTGKETEPWEIIYFKLYKSQLPVVERALETAALMLGSDKSRGYCLEMICADFLAGAALETGESEPNIAYPTTTNGDSFVGSEQTDFDGDTSEMNNSASQKRPRIRATPRLYATMRRVVLERDGWRCQQCGSLQESRCPPHETAKRPR